LILGRGKFLRLKDKRLSVNQVEVLVSEDTDDFCIVKMVGLNPSSITRNSSDRRILLKPSQQYVLHDGDELTLLVTQYTYRVKSKVKKLPTEQLNYLFYSNQRSSCPDGAFIDDLHKRWFGDYNLLEVHHGYIQFLFPLFEGNGLNFWAKKLKKEEAKLMRADVAISNRIVMSYKLMLDFYGLQLVDSVTGKICRNNNWESRYKNLNSNSHNNLRITRILTSLGHLGFSKWKKPLFDFFAQEIASGCLPNCKLALNAFWKETLDINSRQFVLKTSETEDDRVDSIYFTQFAKDSNKN